MNWKQKLDDVLEDGGSIKDFIQSTLREELEEKMSGVAKLEATLGVLEMSGRKTIKIEDVRYYLNPTN